MARTLDAVPRPAAVRAHLVRDGRPTIALATYLVALLAWAVLVEQPMPMPAARMAMDPSAPGAVEAMGTAGGPRAVVGYLLMWGVMMVAMMYPAAATTFQWYADRLGEGRTASRTFASVTFVAAYTALWVLVGLVPLGLDAVVSISTLAATWGPLYFGVSFLLVGLFQLSPVKRHCLHHCRPPSEPTADRVRPGIASAVRAGLDLGRWDLGACGVLMGLMVVVGSMNVQWMALITGVMCVERLTTRGSRWARRFGLAAVAVGLGLIAVWLL